MKIYTIRLGDTIYVGRTRNVGSRMANHLRAAVTGSSEPVHAWIRQLLEDDLWPKVRVVQKEVTGPVSVAEGYWIAFYSRQGLTVLNKNLMTGKRSYGRGRKFPPEIIEAIKAESSAGVTVEELASKYRTTENWVQRILRQ